MVKTIIFIIKSMGDNSCRNKNDVKETIIPDEEILMAIKTEPEIIIEHEDIVSKMLVKFVKWAVIMENMAPFDEDYATSLDKKIDQLRVVMEQKLNHIQVQIHGILEAQEEQNILLRNFIASQQDMNSKFPLKTAKNLKELDEEITPENRETYKNTIITLLKPQGIRKNLKYILSTEIINEYNIDGVHGKKCLKDLKNFYEVVIDSIKITSKSGTAEQQLRDAIRLAKKRYLKNKSVSRKNANNSEMEYE